MIRSFLMLNLILFSFLLAPGAFHAQQIVTAPEKLPLGKRVWIATQIYSSIGTYVKELRTIFPKVPVGFPEGADSEDSTYLHLLVNTLEYRADKELLGELRARQIMEFWATDHYRWAYRQVLDEGDKIRAVLRKYKLVI